MKICIFNTLYYPYSYGGAEESVRLLAEEMVSRGHEVYVITLGNKSSSIIFNGVHIFRLKIKNIYWPYSREYKRGLIKLIFWNALDLYNIFFKKELVELVSSINPDVLHTNNIKGFSVVAWDVGKKLNIPILHTSRDFYLLHPNSTLSKPKRENVLSKSVNFGVNLRKAFMKKMSKKVNFYVGISNFMEAFYLEHGFFDGKKSFIVYNSISKSKVNASVKYKNGNDVVFGFLGRVCSEKGFEVLACALKQTKIKKIIVGGHVSEDYKKELMEKYFSIEFVFLGFISRTDFFNSIDCLIVPSLWEEPFGRVVIEAFSFGVPVVASNAGGLPELIDSRTGWVFEKGDYKGLAGILISIDQEKIFFMRKACIARSKEFSCSVIGGKYEEIYYSLIQSSKPN